jgi:DNA-binding Lrp family transcriptional regulator
MSIKIDAKDRKLLMLLNENSRYSNSQLAKKIGLSKPAIEYRLKRLEKNNAIMQYYAVIDFMKLGYNPYKLYLKLQNAGIAEEEAIIRYWVSDPNTIWAASIRGRWNVAVTIFARSNNEFGIILGKFMKIHAKYILEKDILLVEHSEIHETLEYGMPKNIIQLDDADKKILKAISVNARLSIVEMIAKTRLTRDTIVYRLKRLTKDGIIAQFKCMPNYEVIGKKYYKLMIRTKNLDEKSELKLREYSAISRYAPQFLKLIGSWDIEIELELDDEDTLYKIIADIRKEFSDILRDYDTLRIIKTYKYDFYPFEAEIKNPRK